MSVALLSRALSNEVWQGPEAVPPFQFEVVSGRLAPPGQLHTDSQATDVAEQDGGEVTLQRGVEQSSRVDHGWGGLRVAGQWSLLVCLLYATKQVSYRLLAADKYSAASCLAVRMPLGRSCPVGTTCENNARGTLADANCAVISSNTIALNSDSAASACCIRLQALYRKHRHVPRACVSFVRRLMRPHATAMSPKLYS